MKRYNYLLWLYYYDSIMLIQTKQNYFQNIHDAKLQILDNAKLFYSCKLIDSNHILLNI
jgi:hypothetical protein